MIVELKFRKRGMRGDGISSWETGTWRISCASQFTITDTAGTSADAVRNHINTRSSKPNHASRTPDFPYPLVASILFPSASPLSLFLVHTSIIIVECKVESSMSISPCHDHELTASTTYIKYSIHQVQHTTSTACTQDCLSSQHYHHYKLTPECSFSFRRASLYDWPPPGHSPSELILPHSHGGELTNWRIECHQDLAHLPLTASKSCTKVARSWSQTWCISNLPWGWPPSVSPNLLDYGLQAGSIMASKCISKLCRPQPPSDLWVHWIVMFRHTSNCSQAPPAASPDISSVVG